MGNTYKSFTYKMESDFIGPSKCLEENGRGLLYCKVVNMSSFCVKWKLVG